MKFRRQFEADFVTGVAISRLQYPVENLKNLHIYQSGILGNGDGKSEAKQFIWYLV